MTHRERVLAAVTHQEPDRVPLDYGSTIASTHIKNDVPPANVEAMFDEARVYGCY
jgi:hypothetical protein